MFFGGFDDSFALIVSNVQIGTMLDEKRDRVVINIGKDRRLAVVVSSVHIGAKLQQLFFDIGQKSFMKRRIAVFVPRVHTCSSLSKQPHAFDACTFFIGVAVIGSCEDGSLTLTILRF